MQYLFKGNPNNNLNSLLMKTFFIALFSLLSLSCSEMRKSGTQESKDHIIVDEETENLLQLDDRMAVETSVDAVDAWSEEVEILLPFPYRIYDCDPTESIDSTWMELYVENDTFFIDNADFSIIEGMDDCSGYPTKTIQTERNTLVFFNIPTLKAGRVNNIEVEQKRVWPNEQIQIVFDNTSYQLRAEGEVLSSETVVFSNEIGPEKWQEVADYRLFFSSGNGEELLLFDILAFHYTFVELLFVGDIDGDGKLDFIFSNPLHYEEKRVTLFLSTYTDQDIGLRKVAEIAVGFDC